MKPSAEDSESKLKATEPRSAESGIVVPDNSKEDNCSRNQLVNKSQTIDMSEVKSRGDILQKKAKTRQVSQLDQTTAPMAERPDSLH